MINELTDDSADNTNNDYSTHERIDYILKTLTGSLRSSLNGNLTISIPAGRIADILATMTPADRIDSRQLAIYMALRPLVPVEIFTDDALRQTIKSLVPVVGKWEFGKENFADQLANVVEYNGANANIAQRIDKFLSFNVAFDRSAYWASHMLRPVLWAIGSASVRSTTYALFRAASYRYAVYESWLMTMEMRDKKTREVLRIRRPDDKDDDC